MLPWNRTNSPPTFGSIVTGFRVHFANLSESTNAEYKSAAVAVNSMSSVKSDVLTAFGFTCPVGAGVGGLDTTGVAVTELFGVEFKEGL
jgi:hypothetical protein